MHGMGRLPDQLRLARLRTITLMVCGVRNVRPPKVGARDAGIGHHHGQHRELRRRDIEVGQRLLHRRPHRHAEPAAPGSRDGPRGPRLPSPGPGTVVTSLSALLCCIQVEYYGKLPVDPKLAELAAATSWPRTNRISKPPLPSASSGMPLPSDLATGRTGMAGREIVEAACSVR